MSRKILRAAWTPSALLVSTSLSVASLLIRLAGLSLDSLWFDEVFSLRAARMSVNEIVTLTRGDVHPPLYYLLLHFWVKNFGETPAAVRLLSVVFSSLTVFALYHLARELFDARSALFAALFATLSPFQVFYAQETRMYAQLTFLATASIYCFAVWLKEGRRLHLAFYVISTTLLLYTHIYAAFVVAAELLYFALLVTKEREAFRQRLRPFSGALSVTGLLFLPWALVILQQATRARRGFWIQEPDWLAPFSTLIEYCGSLWLALLLLPLFVYGMKRCGNEKSDSLPRTRWLLLLWLLLPVVVPFLLSKLLTPFYLSKYTIAASLPFYLFAGSGLARVRGRVLRAALLLFICLFAGTELKRDLTTLKRERWKDAAYNVEREARAGDLVLFNSTGSYLSYAYYSGRKDLRAAVFPYSAPETGAPDDLTLLQRTAAEGFGTIHAPQTEDETREKLRKIVGEQERVWLVTRYGEGFKNDFMRAFDGEFRLTTQPALCFHQRSFLFTEKYNETDGAIILERSGESCTAAQVYLLERKPRLDTTE